MMSTKRAHLRLDTMMWPANVSSPAIYVGNQRCSIFMVVIVQLKCYSAFTHKHSSIRSLFYVLMTTLLPDCFKVYIPLTRETFLIKMRSIFSRLGLIIYRPCLLSQPIRRTQLTYV